MQKNRNSCYPCGIGHYGPNIRYGVSLYLPSSSFNTDFGNFDFLVSIELNFFGPTHFLVSGIFGDPDPPILIVVK